MIEGNQKTGASSSLSRRDGESNAEYHKRLIFGKLVDKTLADIDYTELAELVYGQTYSSDVARRMMYGSRKTLELLGSECFDRIEDDDLLSSIDEKIIELRKERQKFYDQRNAFNKSIRDRSRQEELNEILTAAIASGDLPKLDYVRTEIPASTNDLLVSLNDIHYGAQHANYWGEYNSDICREMMRGYLDRILHIAETHHSENCIVWENGDAISGQIHRSIQVTNKENVIDQIKGVSELIAEFLAELSRHFNKVIFVSVAGNHSRLDPLKDAALKDERLDDLIEWYLSARLQNFDNVIIGAGDKVDTTMYLINIRGKNYCGVHGDYDATESKVQSVQTMIGKPVYAILSGHLHHNKVDEIQGVKTIMAGSFLGMDDFCIQKRIFGKPEQMVCVCDETGVVCHYDIPLR